MRYSSVLYTRWLVLIGLFGILIVAGCSGGGKITGGGNAQYTLEVVAERNLDDHVDYLYVSFLRDGITVTDGYVKIDGDSLSLSARGEAFVSYSSGHFAFGMPIQIDAQDPDSGYSYQTSITLPSTMSAEVVPEADSIWQPNKGTLSIQFTLASPATGYILSVTPRTNGTAAPGYASDAGTGQLVSFSPLEAFYNQQTGNLVSDYYDVRMIAFNGTFLAHPQSTYVLPNIVYSPTLKTDEIVTYISAQVVSPRAVIQAMELQP